MSGVEGYLGIPKAGAVNQRIALKDIVEQLTLSGNEKKQFESDIYSVHLIGVLDADTIHVLPYIDEEYLYETIYVIKTVLKSTDRFSFIVEKIHLAFPNPLIIVIEKDEKWVISLAPKRINKNDHDKSVIESIYSTNWFIIDDQHQQMLKEMDINEIRAENLKDFYKLVITRVYSERLIEFLGFFPAAVSPNINMQLIIEQIDRESISLRCTEQLYIKARMMSEKMKYHRMITTHKKILFSLKNEIEEWISNGKR